MSRTTYSSPVWVEKANTPSPPVFTETFLPSLHLNTSHFLSPQGFCNRQRFPFKLFTPTCVTSAELFLLAETRNAPLANKINAIGIESHAAGTAGNTLIFPSFVALEHHFIYARAIIAHGFHTALKEIM